MPCSLVRIDRVYILSRADPERAADSERGLDSEPGAAGVMKVPFTMSDNTQAGEFRLRVRAAPNTNPSEPLTTDTTKVPAPLRLLRGCSRALRQPELFNTYYKGYYYVSEAVRVMDFNSWC